MLSEKEINISNLSYTKKDFASIYPELVDLVLSLTTRWDPKTSNESDPGVVLTKEAAFIGDKLNYNVDKNILETFMPSATQESSMRKNCESRAYEMEYYNAAETEITFTYNGEALDSTLTLPKYETVVGSDDDSITYITLEDVEFNADNYVSIVPAIEGTLNQLTVASDVDEYVIQLTNLDDNNRIYFPVKQVAQNGVFISTDRNPQWRRVKNLNVEQLGQAVYKFGYSSDKGLPYVEFPSDIASLIDSGLTINYITTSGVDGNVQANYLTKLVRTQGTSITTEPDSDGTQELYIKNESASINGANPQSVKEAYESYKRTIGVFDTYVTCRDYETAIYNMLDDDYIYPAVSNAHVADRRDDINYGVRYVAFGETGPLFKNYRTGVNVTAYDLCLYPLASIKSYNLDSYYDSFTPALNTSWIEEELEELKCVSHDYKTLLTNDIYAIKNISTLDARIVTTYKVGSYERVEIINNIQQALVKNFNAREVDYGYEIPYDTILQVIQNADQRISFVSLAEPELHTVYMNKEGTEIPQISKSGVEDYFSVVLARDILSGKISLLEFNDEFAFDFGQTDCHVLDELAKVKSQAQITLANNTSYTLQKNEVIQLVGPSLIEDYSFGAYAMVAWLDNSNPSQPNSNTIQANKNYQLTANDKLLTYTVDSNKVVHADFLPVGTIIQPNFDLVGTSQSAGGGRISKIINGTEYWFKQLGAQESIAVKKINSTSLTESRSCYWIRNNSDNALFTSADETSSGSGVYEILLEDGEYFFYTDAGFNTLVTLGSGTTIRTSIAPTGDTWKVKKISLKDIIEQGLLALKSYWKMMILSTNDYIDIQENTIFTLVYNNSIKLSGITSSLVLNNQLQQLANTVDVNYVIDDNSGQLDKYDLGSLSWRIKSRLDIVASKDKAQTLNSTSDCTQTITFYDKDWDDANPDNAHKLDLVSGDSFNLNLSVDLAGGDAVDVTSLDINNNITNPLTVYSYELTENISRDTKKYFELKLNDGDSSDYDVPQVLSNSSLLTLYFIPGTRLDPSTPIELDITAKDSSDNDVTIYLYGTSTSPEITTEGGYTVGLPSSVAKVSFECSEGNCSVIVDVPKFYSGYNSKLGVKTICDELERTGVIVSSATECASVYAKIENYIKNHSDGNFYYGLQPDNSNVIESDDLSSPYALYDYNNVANKCTISQIDIENSNIDVVRSSRQ